MTTAWPYAEILCLNPNWLRPTSRCLLELNPPQSSPHSWGEQARCMMADTRTRRKMRPKLTMEGRWAEKEAAASLIGRWFRLKVSHVQQKTAFRRGRWKMRIPCSWSLIKQAVWDLANGFDLQPSHKKKYEDICCILLFSKNKAILTCYIINWDIGIVYYCFLLSPELKVREEISDESLMLKHLPTTLDVHPAENLS